MAKYPCVSPGNGLRFDKHLMVSEGNEIKLIHQSPDVEMNSLGKGWNEGSNKANKYSCQTEGSALAWRCPQGQGQKGGGGALGWKLLPVGLSWNCQGGIRRGWNLPAWTGRCVRGCPLNPGTALRKQGRGAAFRPSVKHSLSLKGSLLIGTGKR